MKTTAKTYTCSVCNKETNDEVTTRFTTIGWVCGECYPVYDKINTLLCKQHGEYLKTKLKEIENMFD